MRIEQIYNKYKVQLKGYVSRHIPSLVVADDIVQDVFYKFIEADRKKTIESVSSWLYRVAQNQIIDHSRKRKEESMPYFAENRDDELFYIALVDLLTDEKQTPELELIRSMVWEEFEKALAELPDEQRNVFEMTELEGIPFNDISDATGIAVNTLISRKRYAVQHLRRALVELYQNIGIL